MLPVCVIRKILCYLTYREATWKRSISKAWRLAWLDLHDFEFPKEDEATEDNSMERNRDESIPFYRNFFKVDCGMLDICGCFSMKFSSQETQSTIDK